MEARAHMDTRRHNTVGRQRSGLGCRRRGFTLLESLMALVIIGVGVLAFVDAQSSFIRSNGWSSQAATGMFLAQEVREFSRHLRRHDPVTGLSLSGGAAVGWGREANEVAVVDLDDVDDMDGVTFGLGGTFTGPINASGMVIPEIDLTGIVETASGVTVPLQGWTQRVIVDKVDPYNTTQARDDSYQQAATTQLPFIAIDKFPLRVTVIVEYQGVTDATATEITRLSWVVPAK